MRLAPIIALAIIVLSAAAIAPIAAQAPPPLTVNTDKSSYRPGEVVTVFGKAPAGMDVFISIVNPRGSEAYGNVVTADQQGNYMVKVQLPFTLPYPPDRPLWVVGNYTVRAYVGSIVATTSFTLTAGGVVTGRVVDENNNPVQGATITVLETGASTSTGINGRFSIETGPGNFTLEVTKAGYLRTKVNVSVSVGQTIDLGDVKILSVEYVISQLQEQVNNLTAQNKQLAAQIEALTAQLEALRNQFMAAQEALTEALGNISSKLDSLSRDLANNFSSISSTLSDITSRLGVLDQLRTAVDALRTDITGLRTDINTLTSGQKDLSSRVDALSSKLDTVSTDLRNSISSAQNSLSSALTSAINSVNSRIDNVSASVGSLTVPVIIAVILSLLAFVFALLTFLQVRRAMAAK